MSTWMDNLDFCVFGKGWKRVSIAACSRHV